jgi:hypothetical protein
MSRLNPITVACVLLPLVFMVPACGDDEDNGGAGGTAGTNNTGGSGGSSGSGATSGGGGSSGSGGTSTGTGGSSGSSGGSGGSGGSNTDGGAGFGGNEMQVCPAAQPTNGGACEPGRGDCEFGDNICDCLRESDTWVCWNPATDCPATAPADESACTLVGVECEYDNGDCECEDDGWSCDIDDQEDEDGGV